MAYKRPENIRNKLIRSKIPPLTNQRESRTVPGMKKCLKCKICPFVKNSNVVRSSKTSEVIEINKQVDCQTKNVIYCITCKKCKVQYIGESEKSLKERFSQHLGYVYNEHLNQATGEHFNSKGHSVADMEVTILEKIFSKDPQVRKERESMFIKKFNSKHKGLNKKS